MKFKIYRFAAKHKLLFSILSSVLLCLVYSVCLAYLGASWWLIVLPDLLICFVYFLYPSAAAGKLVDAAHKELQQNCDPEPLYLETKEQLTHKFSDADRQGLLINHCVALREMGQWQQAMDIMKTIHIDKHAGTLPYAKVIYYNNLSDLCELLGDNASADIWYEKSIQIYNDMPENRLRKLLDPSIPTLHAAFHYRNGRYAEAMVWAKQMPRGNRHRTVSYALNYGQIAIGLKDYENARKALQYAVANGNKTCAVQIAKKLLAELDEAEKAEV